jgi:hypothetical protein
MAVAEDAGVQLSVRFGLLLPYLNERRRRLLLATEARLLRHGGVRAVAQVARVSETTIRKGLLELDAGEKPLPGGRARRPGDGRNGLRTKTRSWCLPCCGWSSQTSGGIRCRRCAGRRVMGRLGIGYDAIDKWLLDRYQLPSHERWRVRKQCFEAAR